MRTKFNKLVLLAAMLFSPGLAYAGACSDLADDPTIDNAIGCIHEIAEALDGDE